MGAPKLERVRKHNITKYRAVAPHPPLRIPNHLHKEVRKRRTTELRILAPVNVPVLYSLLVRRVAEAR